MSPCKRQFWCKRAAAVSREEVSEAVARKLDMALERVQFTSETNKFSMDLLRVLCYQVDQTWCDGDSLFCEDASAYSFMMPKWLERDVTAR